MANRFTPCVRPLLAVAALAASAIAVPTLAQAAPRTAPHSAPLAAPRSEPSITTVQKRLGALATQNSQLVEQYNQAQVAVQKGQRSFVAASRTAKATARAYETHRAQFVQLIQAQYEGTSMGSTAALLDSDSNSNYLDRLATLSMVSSNTADVVRQVHQARDAAQAASTKAAKLLVSAKADRAALTKKKTDVAAQIDKYRTLLDTLSARQRTLFTNADAPAKADTAPKHLQHLTAAGSGAARTAVKFALAQVGKPYVFGAAGPGSYDCSGLTMRAWQKAGVSLPHSAADQYNYGHHVDRSELQPGDLIFLYQPIGHVEIYIGDGMAVSAPTEGQPVQVVTVGHNSGDYVGATRLS